jgi:hypothetical protein
MKNMRVKRQRPVSKSLSKDTFGDKKFSEDDGSHESEIS